VKYDEIGVKYGEIGVTVSDPLRGPKDYQVRD
jgi:hypothetical protein